MVRCALSCVVQVEFAFLLKNYGELGQELWKTHYAVNVELWLGSEALEAATATTVTDCSESRLVWSVISAPSRSSSTIRCSGTPVCEERDSINSRRTVKLRAWWSTRSTVVPVIGPYSSASILTCPNSGHQRLGSVQNGGAPDLPAAPLEPQNR